ncbi:hypothetical protein [Pseudorhodobacter sp.]|nr:hypothetical protein [Pseudorhodobacter sp.]MDN5789080.1 hypothetical protein [Pseudorhodobacter sp.]
MVCFGLSCDGKATITETVQFGALGRDLVRRAAVDHALKMLAAALAQMN